MRLGLFGGTFDPIHVGHLDVARAARHALDLDAVWLIPANRPPHRRTPLASAAHRFAMVALAVAANDGMGLLASDIEMGGTEPSYTSDTLDRLERLGYQGRSLFFIAGADAFRDIPAWKAYPHLLDRCHFVIVSRPGTAARALPVLLPALASRMTTGVHVADDRTAIFLVDAPTSPVSSTEVRRAAIEGRSLDGLVPPAVAGHIGRHGLYREHGAEIMARTGPSA